MTGLKFARAAGSRHGHSAARRLPALGAGLLAVLLAALAPAALQAAPVKEISIVQQGDVPVDTNSVLAFTTVRVGQDITRANLSTDVRELERSGRFSFVAAQIEDAPGGVRIVYQISQKPRINRIEITGAEEIGNKKVRELLELGAGDLVDDATIATRALKVREHYAKKYYPDAKLAWTIETEKETGLAVVRVKVEEGRHAHVRNITFPGAVSVKARTLRKAMKQQERGFWSWITGSGTLNQDDLYADKETLRRVFQDKGLLDVKIGDPVITSAAGKYIDIEIPVTEGRPYSLGKLELKGVTLFPVGDVAKVVTNRPGQIASMGSIEASAKAVRGYYGNRGYIATKVTPLMTPTADGQAVDISFDVVEGRKAHIRDVLVRGNTTTKDKVIRRELTVYPGEEYNEAKIRNSENRLRNLGYFKFVNAVPEDTTDPSQYDLAFELEEQRTGNLMVGAGFSSIDNLIGFVELSQGNFDIGRWPPTGGGQKLRIRGTAGSRRRDMEVSFIEPWFLDRKLSLGVDLFQHDERYSSDYHLRDTGGRLTLGKALGTYSRVNLSYGLENYDVYDVSTNASQTIQDEEGSRLKSSVTLELVRDTRDNFFVPSRGMRTSVSAQLAGGPLGADTDLYKFTAQASKFWPVWWDHVFNVRGTWASVDHYGDSDRVPIFDRLFLGGARTLRGFKYREVGPKDENGEPVGGQTSGFLAFEYTIPVVEKIRYALFYDIGMAYPEAFENSWDELNSDWGMGIRFDIPGFPMRLDYAWPIQTDEFNDRKGGRFQFSLGYAY